MWTLPAHRVSNNYHRFNTNTLHRFETKKKEKYSIFHKNENSDTAELSIIKEGTETNSKNKKFLKHFNVT